MDYTIISELGKRDINEDHAKAASFGDVNCFVVCDGLGGHGKGEVASETAANTLMDCFRAQPALNAETVAGAFESAQRILLEMQNAQKAKNEMKTTAVVLLTDQTSALWGHIGDSRLYLFYKNKIVLRTLDHSVPQMLVMAGDIKEKQIRLHPDRNRLLRVLGCEWESRKYEISDVRALSKCQAFLLCTDGFWEYITEKMMCKFLKRSSSAEEWMSFMLEEVQKNGIGADMDNHTAIAVML